MYSRIYGNVGIVRKEKEIKNRSGAPRGELRKSDKEVYAEREAKESEKRRSAFEATTKKKYNDLSSDQISQLVAKICKRIYMFDGEYPQFLTDTVKEIVQHPNTTVTDKQVPCI